MSKLSDGKWYWGYVDVEEKIHIKRYTNDRVIRNYEQMPFTLGIVEPFKAKNIEEAAHLVVQRWREQRGTFLKKESN
jgi:hypothetical protein